MGHQLSIESLCGDVLVILKTLYGDSSPAILLVGHSMGGSVAVHVAARKVLPNLAGLIVVDVVEGTAMASLMHMQKLLSNRMQYFPTIEKAIEWSVNGGTLRNIESARISIPSTVKYDDSKNCYVHRARLMEPEQYWRGWYKGSLVQSSQHDKIMLDVTGMQSEMDVQLLEKILCNLKGVRQFYFNRPSKDLEVLFDPLVLSSRALVDGIEEGSSGNFNLHVDGLVVWGTSYVNESMVTGEAVPVSKEVNSLVIGGTINLHGSFHIEATKVGSDTVLSQIVSMVEMAQMSKAHIHKFADYVASIFVPTVIVFSLLTFFGWYIGGVLGSYPEHWLPENGNHFVFALMFAISVVVIACPCALGLATPTAVMVATGVGASNGVLIKGGDALERAQMVNCVVFDKTGTYYWSNARKVSNGTS